MDEACRVPDCGQAATSGEWREPFSKFRWGVELSVTVQDLALTWPLCADHADDLLAGALNGVEATLTEWGLRPGYRGLEQQ